MNANEVLKALVCCYKASADCKNCAFNENSPNCIPKLEKAAADLLKSQQVRILELERAKLKDVELLKKQIADFKRTVKSENSDYLMGYISALSAVEGMIAVLPTAGDKPAVHSEWGIDCDGYYPFCKNCGKEPKGGAMTDYCPNCGARMEKY